MRSQGLVLLFLFLCAVDGVADSIVGSSKFKVFRASPSHEQAERRAMCHWHERHFLGLPLVPFLCASQEEVTKFGN